jgi:1-phosphofructokinase
MSEPNVITITLNPSLDRTLVVHYLNVGYHNRTRETTRLDPAGKGVNIARALHQLGCPTRAIVLLGDDATGKAFKSIIADEGFGVTAITVSGNTRSNIFILDDGNHTETAVIEDGPTITQADLDLVMGTMQQQIKEGDFVVLAGSLPNGAPTDTLAQLCQVAHSIGAQVAIVAGGEPLEKALPTKPLLVALSQAEAEAFFNFPVRAKEDVLGCARHLREQGAQQVLLEMRTTNHALLIAEEGQWEVDLPPVAGEGTSTGIWSALRAGFLAGWATKRPLPESLELGVAAAAYVAEQIGSEFGRIEDVKPYREDVTIHPVVNGMREPLSL